MQHGEQAATIHRAWARARRVVGAVAVAASVAAAVSAPAGVGAQSDAGSQESTTTTTSAPAESTTTSSTLVAVPGDPGDPGGPASDPPPEENGDPAEPAEAPPEAPPEEHFDVPPPQRPPSIDTRNVRRVVSRQLEEARADAAAAEAARVEAEGRVRSLEELLADLDARRRRLRAGQRQAVVRLRDAKLDMRERASVAFIRGPFTELATVLESQDPNDFLRRLELLKGVLDADQAAIGEYRAAKKATAEALVQLAEDEITARDDLVTARYDQYLLTDGATLAAERLAILEASATIAVAGFVFPVGEPHSFVDTFWAPRMTGTQYEHRHQGTDIFAPSGTPLFACERGIVTRMGTDVLGGTKLWLVGASGHRYYYAHLSAFAEGLVDGMAVEAGDVVGYVGDTGNARGGAAHLHYEIHPGGGPAVNPYPMLRVIDDASRRARQRR